MFLTLNHICPNKNGEVNPGDSLILDTDTFSKMHPDINTQSIPMNLIPIIVGNLLQENINEIDREHKRFKALALNSHCTTSTVTESYTNQVSSKTLVGHMITNPSSHDIRNTHSHHLAIHDFTKVCSSSTTKPTPVSTNRKCITQSKSSIASPLGESLNAKHPIPPTCVQSELLAKQRLVSCGDEPDLEILAEVVS